MHGSEPREAAAQPGEYRAARLKDALATDERVNELDVHLSVDGDDLFITGQVATPERREAVARVAAELAPDMTIHNDIEVISLADPQGPETLP